MLENRADIATLENALYPSKGNKTAWYPNVYFTNKQYGLMAVVCYHDPKHQDPWYLVSNLDHPSLIIRLYNKRFGIETLFGDLKSRGFNIHKSQLRCPERLSRLLIAVCLAFIFTILAHLQSEKLPYNFMKKICRQDQPNHFSPFFRGKLLLKFIFDFPDLISNSFKELFSNLICVRFWKKYKEIKKTKIPNSLKQLFNANKKKDQVKLLKGFSITSDILIAFLFYAWEEKGYSFSQYKGEHERKGLDKSELPNIIHVKGDKVERVGDSELTDGQLKQAIQQRTVVIAKFIDKGDDWHCLFATYNSLKGEENWQNGQPHFHYISSKFGIPRDKVIESLKSRHYKLGSLPHINLTNYGVQPHNKVEEKEIITSDKAKEKKYNPEHDDSLWRYIQQGGSLTYKDYLNKYPNGKYAKQAKEYLE